ncbi:MAG: hypothetical protein WCI31_12025 [Prolixibacteraceae bacterium]
MESEIGKANSNPLAGKRGCYLYSLPGISKMEYSMVQYDLILPPAFNREQEKTTKKARLILFRIPPIS